MFAVALLYISNCVPNGNPLRGGAQRETPDGKALGTPWWFKRFARDTWHDMFGLPIYVQRDSNLIDTQKAYNEDVDAMLKAFIDLRVFGGLTTHGNGRPVHGAVQVEWAESLRSIDPSSHQLTRVAKGTDKSKLKDDETEGANMGTIRILTGTLLPVVIAYNPVRGARNGVSSEDLALLWPAVIEGVEHGMSSMRSGIHLARIDVVQLAPGKRPVRFYRRSMLQRLQVHDPAPDHGREGADLDECEVSFNTAGLPEGARHFCYVAGLALDQAAAK